MNGITAQNELISISPFQESWADETKEVFLKSWRYLAEDILRLDLRGVRPEEWPLDPTFVALVNGKIVGLIQLKKIYLQRLYVLPSFHGKGIGNALLLKAREEGATTLAVDEANWPARRFYEAHGWRWNGERRPGVNFPEKHTLVYVVEDL